MKRYSLLLLLLFAGFGAMAQAPVFPPGYHDGVFKSQRSWMLNCGYTYQTQHIIEFGFKRTSLGRISHNDGQEFMSYMNNSYFILGGEIVYDPAKNAKPQFQLAPKVGAGYNFLIFNANVNIIGYNDFKSFHPAFVPEAGLSFFAIVQIDYGYNFYLTGPVPSEKYRHRIAVRFNWFINSEYWNGKPQDDKKNRELDTTNK